MSRIVFLCPFLKTEITGGIKTAYAHAEMLEDLGFDACVYQPDGRPTWFDSRAKTLTMPQLMPQAGDILVFPEVFNGMLAEMAQARTPARKVLFCQNQYFMAMNRMPASGFLQLGFSRFACSSTIAKTFMERAIGLNDVAVIPCSVDGALFRPREKSLQIALVPRKLGREAALIHTIFALKYPNLRSVAWVSIENRTERDTAEIIGRSAVLLALSYLESFGLVPVEAMASGCVVAGFHGYGGLEYATAENGIWLPPDHLEEAADALARIVMGIQNGDPEFKKMREAGTATAARYTKERTQTALKAFYGTMT